MDYMKTLIHTGDKDYHDSFWNMARGKAPQSSDVNILNVARRADSTSFALPNSASDKIEKAIQKKNPFRRLATVHILYGDGSKILAKDTQDKAFWVGDGDTIPVYDAIYDFTNIPIFEYKLANITKLDEFFILDNHFDLEKHLIDKLSKNFSNSEEDAFINGTGVKMPTGILADKGGAEIGVSTDNLSYDDVIELYFSVDKEYRTNSVWMMNDETALKLRTLKDTAGNYLWNNADNTILGKKVIISEFMPSNDKVIAFGDFSYYWICDRDQIHIRTLKEKFSVYNQIGYISYEFLDAKLIRPDAIKVLKLTETQTN